MNTKQCYLIGAGINSGTNINGCELGPDTFRACGISETLANLGHQVEDKGNLSPAPSGQLPNPFNIRNLEETVGWAKSLECETRKALSSGKFPIFLGGDHSLAFGSILGALNYYAEQNRPLYVLWIDAHADFHSLDSSESGNLHGAPVAYLTGEKGFGDYFPNVSHPLKPENLMIMGMRSVDPAERAKLKQTGIHAHDMRRIDEKGVAALLTPFLEEVKANNGVLHVSLDVDGLDPEIAPAVGTDVPGGLSYREAHLIMEILQDYDLTTSLDLVELNPLLDVKAKTARLLIDLTASLLGRSVLS
ncbi:MAG: arginase [Sneathiella sp.]|nr:arginase [Sneathiella sp.]